MRNLATLREQLAPDRRDFLHGYSPTFEQDYSDWFAETWLVYVDRDAQVERLMKRDQLSKDEAESRLAAQWPLEKRKIWPARFLIIMAIRTSFLIMHIPS